MTEAIATIQTLTPIGAVLVIAAVLQVGITQAAKQQSWTKQRTQTIAVAVAGVLGLLAAVVLGFIAGIPDSVVQIVSTILLAIAAVLVLGKALYGVLGYVIPDGTTPATAGTNPLDAATDTAPLVDLDAAEADAVHGRRRAEVRATHAPVDNDGA